MCKRFFCLLSLLLTACGSSLPSTDSVLPFQAHLHRSDVLPATDHVKMYHDFMPFEHHGMLFVRVINHHSVPMFITRIEFPEISMASCAIKSEQNILVKAQSTAEVALLDIARLAQCHPEFDVINGTKFLGLSGDVIKSSFTSIKEVTVQFDISTHQLSSSRTARYSLIFDTDPKSHLYTPEPSS